MERADAKVSVQAEEAVRRFHGLADHLAHDWDDPVMQGGKVRVIVNDEAPERRRFVQLQVSRAQRSGDALNLRQRVVVEDPLQQSHPEARRCVEDSEGIDEGTQDFRSCCLDGGLRSGVLREPHGVVPRIDVAPGRTARHDADSGTGEW